MEYPFCGKFLKSFMWMIFVIITDKVSASSPRGQTNLFNNKDASLRALGEFLFDHGFMCHQRFQQTAAKNPNQTQMSA
jgi:hypothetical protein